jgi:Galactose oxidase, central domain
VNDAEVEARLTHMYRAVATQVTAVPALPDLHTVPEGADRRGRPWRTITLVAACLVVLVCAVAVIRSATGGDSEPGDGARDVETVHAPGGTGGVTIEAMAPSPLSARYAHSAVWTGTEMIVVGGINDDDNDGTSDETDAGSREHGAAAYDPATKAWRTLADPPDLIDGSADAVWAGDEMVVLATDWDDTVNVGAAPDDPAGAIYDPAQDSWRVIAPFPQDMGDLSPDIAAYWVDGRVIVLGVDGVGSSMPPGDGTAVAAYDPTADEWEALDDIPLPFGSAGAASTGDGVVVVGPDTPRRSDGSPAPGTGMAAAALDPTTGTWRALPTPPGAVRSGPVVAWTGTELVVVGGLSGPDTPLADGVALDLATGSWSSVPPPPLAIPSQGTPGGQGYAVGRQVVVVHTWTGEALGPPLVYDAGTEAWYEAPSWPTSRNGGDATVSSGTQLLTWGGYEGEDLTATADGYALTPPGG